MLAKVEATPVLPGLSPVCGKPIIARFDGDQLSSDGGVLALREIDAPKQVASVNRAPSPWQVLAEAQYTTRRRKG